MTKAAIEYIKLSKVRPKSGDTFRELYEAKIQLISNINQLNLIKSLADVNDEQITRINLYIHLYNLYVENINNGIYCDAITLSKMILYEKKIYYSEWIIANIKKIEPYINELEPNDKKIFEDALINMCKVTVNPRKSQAERINAINEFLRASQLLPYISKMGNILTFIGVASFCLASIAIAMGEVIIFGAALLASMGVFYKVADAIKPRDKCEYIGDIAMRYKNEDVEQEEKESCRELVPFR